MLTSQQKRKLKQQAQKLKPLIQIGKNGVNLQTINNIILKLDDHELIKIKYNNHQQEKNELTRQIASRTNSTIIDVIGNTVILYRPSTNLVKRVIKP